jgi:hypothetical protein
MVATRPRTTTIAAIKRAEKNFIILNIITDTAQNKKNSPQRAGAGQKAKNYAAIGFILYGFKSA